MRVLQIWRMCILRTWLYETLDNIAYYTTWHWISDLSSRETNCLWYFNERRSLELKYQRQLVSWDDKSDIQCQGDVISDLLLCVIISKLFIHSRVCLYKLSYSRSDLGYLNVLTLDYVTSPKVHRHIYSIAIRSKVLNVLFNPEKMLFYCIYEAEEVYIVRRLHVAGAANTWEDDGWRTALAAQAVLYCCRLAVCGVCVSPSHSHRLAAVCCGLKYRRNSYCCQRQF